MDIPRPENKKRKRIRQTRDRWRHGVCCSPPSRSVSRGSSPLHRPSTRIGLDRHGRAARRDAARKCAAPARSCRARSVWIAAQIGGPRRARARAARRRRRARHDPRRDVESGLDAPGRGSALRARGREGRARGVRAQRSAAKSSTRRRPSRRRGPRTKARGCKPKPSSDGRRRRAVLTVRRSELLAEQLKATYDIEVERLNQFGATVEAQLAARRARLAQAQNAYDRLREQVEALAVRAGLAGVVQQVMIEEGQQVAARRERRARGAARRAASGAARARDAGTRRA